MLSHSETVEYFMCQHAECGKKFITQKALDLHLKNHAMPKVICSICGKQVKQGSMPLHMILHTGKKIECNLCGKMFQHKGVLNKHIRTIHDEKKTQRAQKEKRKRSKKVGAGTGQLVQAKEIPVLPIQTIQVQLESGDGVGPGLVRVSLPPASELRPGGQLGEAQLQTVTVVSQAGCTVLSGQQVFSPSSAVVVPASQQGAATMQLSAGSLQQFLQLGPAQQSRYQS